MKSFFGVFFIFLSVQAQAALDPYDIMEPLLDSSRHPRVLNTLDLPAWSSDNPEPLFFPEGDFNQDGITDIAISGIYDLGQEKRRYFLLVATTLKGSYKPQQLFLRENDVPVFIHKPASTGEGDPGDQAFSISFCWECDKGEDFYWDKKTKTFKVRPWALRVTRQTKQVIEPAEELPQDVIDLSLQLAGAIPDVQGYVTALKKRKGELITRVEWDKEDPLKKRTVVFITEKKKNGKVLIYDRVTIDLEGKKIFRRSLKASKISR